MTTIVKTLGTGVVTLSLAVGIVGCSLSPQPFPSGATETEKDSTATTAPVSNGTDGYLMTEEAADSAMGYGTHYEPNYNTEEYATVEETGFVSTRTSPLSTISADVDTASYANLRRMLNDGYRVQSAVQTTDPGSGKDDAEAPEDEYPSDVYDDWYYEQEHIIPSGAVRIEEMVNYFDYAYDAPKGDDSFAISARVGACPWNKDTNLLALGYATAAEDESVREKGANLVFLIDVSGSMDDPDKLPLLQSSFGELVDELGENDRVSIVTYSGEEEVVLEGESGANHREIMRAIRSLNASGSTNGEAGLRMAYDLAQKNFIEGGVNRIVMASDGDLNVGMTSESDLHDFVKEKRNSGVYLSVLGFGAGNYKDTKMETLADNGNGSYHYIDCEEEAKRVFGQKLTANLVPFANDVKVQVEFNPEQIKAYRLIGYENRTMADEDFKDDAKDAGEVGPESQFTVLYEIVPIDSAMEINEPELKYDAEAGQGNNSDEWLTAKLRYKTLDGDEAREQELVVDKTQWSEDPGDDWRFAAAVTELGMILRDSSYRGTSSYDSIRALVGNTTDDLRQGFLDIVMLAEKN